MDKGTNKEVDHSVIADRQKIAADYCKQKGWPTDPEALTMDQIMEIRQQPEWINAGGNKIETK